MAKGLEKLYYKLSEQEFHEYLENVQHNPETLHFLQNTDHPYFFLMDQEISGKLLTLYRDQWEFDTLFHSFSDFGRNQIIMTFLINEVQSTNLIENIYSTRHDIYYVLQNGSLRKHRKLRSVVNAYQILLDRKIGLPEDPASLRRVYDLLMENALETQDKPDGEFFRKGHVEISDGMKAVHRGIYPEEKINEAMKEFLKIYNDQNTDIYIRMLIAHFLIETIHPFYDGNGRYGRFLLTMGLYYGTESSMAFLISAAANHRKSKYYRLLNDARGPHMFGSLNQYISDMIDLLHAENTAVMKELKKKQKIIRKSDDLYGEYTKSEKKILHLLTEAACLSEYGVSNQEIIGQTGVSKRTVISAIGKFREEGMLEDTKISKTYYHKLITAE